MMKKFQFSAFFCLLAASLAGAPSRLPAASAPAAAEDAPPPPVGVILTPGEGPAQALKFADGTITLATDFGDVDYRPCEIKSILYGEYPVCTLVTRAGDVLSGTCRTKQFRRLLAGDDLENLDDLLDAPRKLVFRVPGKTPRPPKNVWTLSCKDGSFLRIIPDFDSLTFATPAAKLDIPAAMIDFLSFDIPEGASPILHFRGTGYSVEGRPADRRFRATDAAGRPLTIPWNAVSLLCQSEKNLDSRKLKFKTAVPAVFADAAGGTAAVPVPVTFLDVKTPQLSATIPVTRILRICRNPDRTHTLFTTTGDILTGTVTLDRLLPAPSGDFDPADCPKPADCASIDFPTAKPFPVSLADSPAPLSWRLANGDILVAALRLPAEPPADPARTPPPKNASRLPAAAPVSAAAPAVSEIPHRDASGKWPCKSFDLAPLAAVAPLTLPAAAVETVRHLLPAKLPPACAPTAQGAFHSDFIRLPGGEFTLGRTVGTGPSDEVPPVPIRLAPFALASTPVTVAQFQAFVDDTRHVTAAERTPGEAPTWRQPGFPQTPDDPVVCVSWRDAAAYCNWRSKREGLAPAYRIRNGGQTVEFDPFADGYRLPLEAEWECAARDGGKDIPFPWGTDDSESAALKHANFSPETLAIDPWPDTNPVKAFPATGPGFHDLAGNVWEWCQDIYNPNAYATHYRTSSVEELLNPAPGTHPDSLKRVMRGGSHFNPLPFLRCAARAYGLEKMSAPRVGFRLARSIDE